MKGPFSLSDILPEIFRDLHLIATSSNGVMDPGEYETYWSEYSKRMDPDKYTKFAQCFQRLIEGTNVKDAVSMVTVGIGKCIVGITEKSKVKYCKS